MIKKKVFFLNDFSTLINIGRHSKNKYCFPKEKTNNSSRFHAMIFPYINNRGIVTVALIDPGSSAGIKKKYSNGNYSSRESAFYLGKSSNETFLMGIFEVNIIVELVESIETVEFSENN
jgi:hypothetical protein